MLPCSIEGKEMSNFLKLAVVAAGLAISLDAAHAQGAGVECQAPEPLCQRVAAYITANIKPWASDPAIVSAVTAQNVTSANLTSADIQKSDAAWTDKSDQKLIDSKMNNALSTFLKTKKAAGGDVVQDLLVFDNKGLNVGQTDMTQDYNQSDEIKYSKTFSVGPDAVLVDKASKVGAKNVLQASLSIKDPQTSRAIGAMTVGIDVDNLK